MFCSSTTSCPQCLWSVAACTCVLLLLLPLIHQVFDSALPADLALVWNPRLTATAGQVVDDGSMNHLKAIRAQRIPVRLELSSKVGVLCCRQQQQEEPHTRCPAPRAPYDVGEPFNWARNCRQTPACRGVGRFGCIFLGGTHIKAGGNNKYQDGHLRTVCLRCLRWMFKSPSGGRGC